MSQTLLTLIEAVARRSPSSAAILAVGRDPLTYSGLVAQVRQAAVSLAKLDLRSGDHLAMVLPNGPEAAICFFAVSCVAAAAPLNPAYSVEEFQFYLGDLAPKALITSSDASPQALVAARALNIPILLLMPSASGPAGLFALEPGSPGQKASGPAPEFAKPSDVALVLHTSGTTARPKIVPLTHHNQVSSALSIAASLELSSGDRCLNIMPLFHVHGLIGALCSSLSAGGSVVCSPGCYPAEFFHWLELFQPTWFTAVPTMHQGILARATLTSSIPKQHSLRFIRSCSAALAPKLMSELEAAFRVPVIEAYGMTEASHQMASNPPPPRKRKPGSVGVATGVEIAILDEQGNYRPPGTTGEVAIRGQGVTAGYVGNADANQKAFTNSWFRTGDQGLLDGEGYLFLTGRLKDIINRAGEKISPREIDEVLLDHPAVREAVTFAIPDPTLGEAVGAAVVLREGVSTSESEVRAFAAGRLSHFKVPARVIILPEMPKGPTGKVQRVKMAALLGLSGVTSARPRPSYVEPTTEIEKILAEIWQEVLGLPRVGLRDHFLFLGGDSLAGARIVSRLRQAIQVEIPLAQILDHPVLSDQGRAVEGCRRAQPTDLQDLKQLLEKVEALSTEQARERLQSGSNGKF